jgi:hypothetical protein
VHKYKNFRDLDLKQTLKLTKITVGKQTRFDCKGTFSENKPTKLQTWKITMFYIVDSFHLQMQCFNTTIPLVLTLYLKTSEKFGIHFETIRAEIISGIK